MIYIFIGRVIDKFKFTEGVIGIDAFMDTTTNNCIDIKTIDLADRVAKLNSLDFEELENLFAEICSCIACSYNLCDSDGKARKAIIIDTIAKSTCLACIIKKLSGQIVANDVDRFYMECHTFAVNILVEELYDLLRGIGYKVMISTEAKREYGKADIIITITDYSINLKCGAKELLVEVKTGNSISLSQLFRYLLDRKSGAIVVWRVRKRQVLVFNAQKIKPLLMEFMRVICLRGIRLLSSPRPQPCQHGNQSNYQPTAKELERMFLDYSEAITETLPYALQTILEELDINKTREAE